MSALEPRAALSEAVKLHRAGQYRESLPYYIHAVREDEKRAKLQGRKVDPVILHASGVALAMAGKRREALEFLEEAVAQTPNDGHIWSALALAYVESRQLGKAERSYKLACKLAPTVANWTGFANLAAAGGRLDIAERRYDLALAAPAMDHEELIAQGMTYLRRGHWRKGWRAYEARTLTSMWSERNPHADKIRHSGLPQMSYWRQPGPGDHIFVLTEQGMGDAVQFARYIPRLMERFGCRVTLQAHDALVDMLGSLPCPVIGRTAEYPTDLTGWALLLSLPGVLREKDPKDVPPPVRPYGRTWAVPDSTYLDLHSPRRVFVHGRGNAQHGYDFDRSAPGTVLEDAVRAAGYTVVTAGFEDIAKAGGNVRVMAEPSWKDTVARLASCSRCLTVDTGLAHVAGSLGIPMDLIVPTIPEWRWGKPGAERTPWYPSARLWRKRRTEAWQETVDAIIQSWGTS